MRGEKKESSRYRTGRRGRNPTLQKRRRLVLNNLSRGKKYAGIGYGYAEWI